jgi:hypothetical protein
VRDFGRRVGYMKLVSNLRLSTSSLEKEGRLCFGICIFTIFACLLAHSSINLILHHSPRDASAAVTELSEDALVSESARGAAADRDVFNLCSSEYLFQS